ncbi:GntR family transcriptional regulator [Plantactinospora sp. KLBMP9567]|uniref:GntR family transcriptional regulator n=1 Tax=Plantactinospora sp. KLBMP9567 TaxID=3085900 RepID=UPI003990762E
MGPDDVIDHEGPVPPYRQLAAIRAARIARGDWQPDRAIPSENQLVATYPIARTAVRRAVALLVEQDLIYVVPQRGMFVRRR